MAYRVKLEGGYDEQQFVFRNYDDALNFASMAVDNGTFQGYREEEPHPIRVTLYRIWEPETEEPEPAELPGLIDYNEEAD